MPEGQSIWSQSFYDDVETIHLKDPLAYFLGAMEEGELFVFTYADAVKLAGHSCPAVAGAYKLTAKALAALYGKEIPVRGEIRVAVLGKPTDMAYGPISQIISLITGAAPVTGFGGLGRRFRRRHLLVFDEQNFQYNTFVFQRMDNKKMVSITYNTDLIPEDPRLGELAPIVLSGSASEKEKQDFKKAWQGKVQKVLLEDERIPGLFDIKEIKDYNFPEID